MAYLGNTPTTQSFISGTDYFNGTGAQTAFTLSRTVASINDIQVTVNNVVQQPNDAYTLSGTTLTMTSAPSAGTNNVYVRYLSTTTQVITPSQNTVSWNTLDSNTQQDLGLMYKNKIINGNMVIDQRNAGAAVTVNNATDFYPVDRFLGYGESADGVYTLQQSSTAPAGFVNSIIATVTTADASVGSGQYYFLSHRIEGTNCSDLGFGTANAKTVTLSFWVRSSLTGQFGGSLANSAYNRAYPFTYTINSANTWEQKSITITGDTSGTWLTTTGVGMRIYWDLGSGSSNVGTAGAWGSTGYVGATGDTKLISTLGATFYLTGVQLEVGTQATTFTLAGGSYGAELALCQRYAYVINGSQALNGSTAFSDGTSIYDGSNNPYPVSMRTTPTITNSGTFTLNDGLGATISTTPVWTSFTIGFRLNGTVATGLVTGRTYYLTLNSNAKISISAEL
jgi:hypothetical protein